MVVKSNKYYLIFTLSQKKSTEKYNFNKLQIITYCIITSIVVL